MNCFKTDVNGLDPVASPRNILIIRPSAIGDVVMASPMIRSLRDAFPDARIAWLAEPQVRDLLNAHPGLDRVILWPKSEWRRLLRRGRLLALGREILRLAADLRGEKIDLALDAQGLAKSRLLAWLSGAPERVGFDSREPGRFLMSRVVSKGPHSKRMSSEYRHLMVELGLDPGEFQPHIAVAPEDRRFADNFSREIGSGYAVLAPFTTRPQKHWFEERWTELATEIEGRFDLAVVVLGGPGDAEASRRITSGAKGRIYDLAGKTTLRQVAALVERSALLIGVDTGLTHMGTAFRRPTVALFGSTCPYLETPSPFTRVLYHPHKCSPCRRNPTCEGDFTCMKAISVEEVLKTAASLIAQEGGRG